ncbi:MAG: response regulator, partial [Nitrospirae bacterium]|nr:response regulator [Nitrospirota bacterium]
GIGLTTDQIESLFKPFTQADGSITRKYGGTGLGLTICKRLIEMMEGGIMVKSQYRVGSEFIFTARFNVMAQRKPFYISPDLHNMKVLVVDDNKSSADIIINTLKSFSFNVSSSLSGAEAIQLAKDSLSNSSYNLIIMDCNMPELDGIETAKRIKKLTAIPIIIMSTVNGREDNYREAKSSGIEGFLVKPVTQSILFDAIMDVFGHDGLKSSSLKRRGIYDNNYNSETQTPHYKDIRILLVEDNEINQQVAREIMEKTGLIVETASNGKEAILMVKKIKYDAVLMDIQMPVMDGYTATLEIRKDPEFKDLPILAMTANAMTGDKEKSLKAGMNDHISKPIDPLELFTVLNKWVKTVDVWSGVFPQPNQIIAPAPTKDGILELNGINTKIGLQRVGSNQEFYIEILNKFSVNHANTIEDIKSAIERSDLELAIRLAHTLKGISGTIGAGMVFDVAGALENALTKGDTDTVNYYLPIVKRELDFVLLSISSLQSRNKKSQIYNLNVEIDIIKLKELIEKIIEFLKDDDTQALKYIQRLKEQFPAISSMEEFRRFETLIERYDFEGSLEILSTISNILRI